MAAFRIVAHLELNLSIARFQVGVYVGSTKVSQREAEMKKQVVVGTIQVGTTQVLKTLHCTLQCRGMHFALLKNSLGCADGPLLHCVVVQTISKLGARERVLEQGFKLLVIDEAHHATANTYQVCMVTPSFAEYRGDLFIQLGNMLFYTGSFYFRIDGYFEINHAQPRRK